MALFLPRFLGAAGAFLVLVAVGAVGYVLIEGAPAGDAAYMSVITLTAVGYDEVFPLSAAGRVFTGALLAGGITCMGVWFALITSFIVELDLKDAFRRRTMTRTIADLENHVILCGAGRTGRQVARELATGAGRFVVIERDSERIEDLRDHLPEALVVEGDATHDAVLEEAGVGRAAALVTCLSADADNLFVCLSARDLAPELTIVARAYEEDSVDKLYRAGANHVVSPNVSGAIRMASMILRPTVVSFLDIATRSSDMSLRVEQTLVAESSPLAGKTLEEARIPEQTGLIVMALKKAGQSGHGFVFNPVAGTRMDPGDEVIVLGTREQISRLRDLAG
ncbi:MAG: potassium channel protein [Longimicrobiales bacterium]